MKGVKLRNMDGNISNNEAKEYIIEFLTKLLIELNFKEKKLGQTIYVKKKDCYNDLIKFIKEYM